MDEGGGARGCPAATQLNGGALAAAVVVLSMSVSRGSRQRPAW